MVQMRKILLCSISLESHIKWFSVMVLMCKMIISPWAFSIFSKFWFGGLLGCVKEQKIAQNDKTFCLLCSISQEPYIMWLSFVVHKCKMMISPCVFFQFLKILIFWVLRRVKGQKIVQNDKRFSLPTPYLKNHGSHDCHLWYTSLKRWYLHAFFSFYQNFDFLGC